MDNFIFCKAQIFYLILLHYVIIYYFRGFDFALVVVVMILILHLFH